MRKDKAYIIQHHCNICGNNITAQTFLYGNCKCNKCKNRHSTYIFTKKFLYQEYIVNRKSASKIAKETKCLPKYVLKQLRIFKIKVRTKSEAHLGIKRKAFKLSTRRKMSLIRRGIKLSKLTREKLCLAHKGAKATTNKSTIIKHHINLNRKNNKDNNILNLTVSVHSSLHNRAYEYLVKTKQIKKYLKWFFKYGYKIERYKDK